LGVLPTKTSQTDVMLLSFPHRYMAYLMFKQVTAIRRLFGCMAVKTLNDILFRQMISIKVNMLFLRIHNGKQD
jgi:hypothetical protein